MAIKQQSDPNPLCCPEVEQPGQADLLALEGPQADEELAKLAKAIGHPARVRILRMLSRKEARVCSQLVGELPLAQSTVSEHLRILKDAARVCSQLVGELPLAQSTVSEHLRILKDAGLIRSNQDGPRVGYCINYNTLRRLKALAAII